MVRLKKPFRACAVFLGATIGLYATPVCPPMGTSRAGLLSVARRPPLKARGSCPAASPDVSNFTYSDSAATIFGSVPTLPVTQANVTSTKIESWPSDIGFLFAMSPNAGTDGTNNHAMGHTADGSGIEDAGVGGGNGMMTLSEFTDTVTQMDPVPEPGFYGVLAGGLGAVLMFARRRKKSA